ncbi:hypothetical protein ETB97_010971 [Aspergillus alliaceus]|uniref:Uncharacterized protein n=1 Tax=Petromyces alliaceus TaxID=209559 RepID=A0A5N6FPZ3_PETAA|nr:uncharacterized protein BDW43DRAFT_312385 [Aspergillus alliaceus]KAB8232061.1 hypothetical protein BDW43DRAFT_312385 [Aspergillus alliaceus]KAF5862930.1 hypothetical protein ETB97_010971 [Aspergillus burnettii]
MMFFAILVTLTTLLFTPMGQPVDKIPPRGIGAIKIVNTLDSPLYAWSDPDPQGSMYTIPGRSGTYEETYRLSPTGDAISIKVSKTPDRKVNDAIQFKYTLSGDRVLWAVSCANIRPGSPFTRRGFSVHPSSAGCPSINCAPGDDKCPQVHPWSNTTHRCGLTTSLTLKL